MRLRSLRTTSKPKLMIIPMIDIIFFLLVFFMMSMLSMVVQKSMPVDLPTAQTSKVDVQRKIPITVMKDGSMYVNDTKLDLNGLVQYMRIEQAKGDKEHMVVILRGDSQAQYGNFVQVLDTLKDMGITNIAIATETK